MPPPTRHPRRGPSGSPSSSDLTTRTTTLGPSTRTVGGPSHVADTGVRDTSTMRRLSGHPFPHRVRFDAQAADHSLTCLRPGRSGSLVVPRRLASRNAPHWPARTERNAHPAHADTPRQAEPRRRSAPCESAPWLTPPGRTLTALEVHASRPKRSRLRCREDATAARGSGDVSGSSSAVVTQTNGPATARWSGRSRLREGVSPPSPSG